MLNINSYHLNDFKHLNSVRYESVLVLRLLIVLNALNFMAVLMSLSSGSMTTTTTLKKLPQPLLHIPPQVLPPQVYNVYYTAGTTTSIRHYYYCRLQLLPPQQPVPTTNTADTNSRNNRRGNISVVLSVEVSIDNTD